MFTQTLRQDCSSDAFSQPQLKKAVEKISFEELYERYYNLIYRLCLRMTHNEADAEDLTQDSLLQAQSKIDTFRGDSAITSWLYRITVNQVLMHFRKRHMHSERITDTGIMFDRMDPSTSNPRAMPIIDRIALAAAVKKLPPGYRSVFLLHDVEGYEHLQAAKILGISDGTSKSQLHKSRMRLRAILSERIEPAQPLTAAKDY